MNFIDSSTALFDNIKSYKWNFGDADTSAFKKSISHLFSSQIFIIQHLL